MGNRICSVVRWRLAEAVALGIALWFGTAGNLLAQNQNPARGKAC